MTLRYRVENQRTKAVTFYDTPEEVITGIPIEDEEEQEFIFALGEDSETEVHNGLGDAVSVKTVAARPPPGGEGGRRKKLSRKTQMRTQKHRRGGRRRHLKTLKYREVPRSRSVFQLEGGSHRRLKRS
jgi:hypothetical protein